MTSPFGSFVDQLAGGWYYLYVVPTGFNGKTSDGTGPFAYQSFTPGQRSVFVRNKNYWKHGLPYADTLTIIDFSDNAAVQDALVTNVIQAAGQLDPPQMPALANTSGVRPVASRTGQFKPFTMRIDQAPFSDVNVRQALRLLVDRQQLINSALDGFGVVASDVFAPYDPDFDKSLHRQQDIPQAKFLLKKAGQENLTVTLTTSAVATGMVAMATVLAEQAAAAGVTIKTHTVDPGTFFGDNYLSWTFSQDYYSYAPYLNQVAQSFLGSSSPFNETHSNNPHYDSLYRQANATSQSVHAPGRSCTRCSNSISARAPYIIPTFMDTLDAYTDKIAGYSHQSQQVRRVPVQLGLRALLVRLTGLRRLGPPPRRPAALESPGHHGQPRALLRLRRPGLDPGLRPPRAAGDVAGRCRTLPRSASWTFPVSRHGETMIMPDLPGQYPRTGTTVSGTGTNTDVTCDRGETGRDPDALR